MARGRRSRARVAGARDDRADDDRPHGPGARPDGPRLLRIEALVAGRRGLRRAAVPVGHALHRGDRARARRAGEPRRRIVHHADRDAAPAQADDLRARPTRGDSVGRIRPLGRARARAADPARLRAHPSPRRRDPDPGFDLRRVAAGPLVHDVRRDPRDHDHADHHVARARGHRDDAAQREGSRLRARRDALGDDPRRHHPAAQQGRARRRGDASAWDARWARPSPPRS